MVGWWAGGLDQKHILAADILFDFDEGLTVGKRFYGRFTQLNADIRANRLSQRRIGGAAKNLHLALLFFGESKNPPDRWNRRREL